MAEVPRGYPKFHNEIGAPEVRIGVKEFECVGALPPHDHPHVYLDMGDETVIDCPYCGTRYVFDASLNRLECRPAECFFDESERPRASM